MTVELSGIGLVFSYSKMALGRGLLTLTLDLQPPELRSTLLLFLSQPLCGILLQQPEQTKTKYRPSVRPRN